MLLVQQAVATGYPIPELHHDEAANASAVQQLLDLLRTPGTGAPMWLG